MPMPDRVPVGLRLARVAKLTSQAFDQALASAGGSLPTWLVLMSLKSGRAANQRELAEAIGIQEATLTHHLNALENDGLVTRRRDPDNRRVHRVQLTEQGEVLFQRLRRAASAFDKRLRAGLSKSEVRNLVDLLDRLQSNIASGERDSGQV